MLRWNLMKRALPMALSLCLTVQSVPTTAYASEYLSSDVTEISEEATEDSSVEESAEEISDVTESEETSEAAQEDSAEALAEVEEVVEAAEEAVLTKEADALETEEGVTALELDKSADFAVKSEKDAWFKFTSTEAGYYTFFVQESTNSISLYEYDDMNGDYTRTDNNQSESTYIRLAEYMEANKTVYFKLNTEASKECNGTIIAEKATVATMTSKDGVYTANTEDFSIEVTPEAEYKVIEFGIKMTEQEGKSFSTNGYYLNIVYRYEYNTNRLVRRFALNNEDGYNRGVEISKLSMGYTYDVALELVDAKTGALICVLAPESATSLELTTLTTNQKVVVEEPVCTYNSIKLNYYAVNDVSSIGYAPSDQLDQEKTCYVGVEDGNGTEIFKGLDSDTEYTFRFYNDDDKILAECTAETKAFDGVAYNITAPDEKSGTISIEAAAAGYPDSVSALILYVDVLDKDGISVSSTSENMQQDSTAEKTLKATKEITGLEANTAYTVKVWLQESGDSGKLAQKESSVTTAVGAFSADDITFRASVNETVSTTADYTINVKDYTGTATLKYRVQGSKDSYTTQSVSITGGTASGTMTALQEGATYEIILLADGVRKETTYTHGEAVYAPELTSSPDAYGFELTYQLPSDKVKEGVAYTVQPQYWNGSEYVALTKNSSTYQTLNAGNEYTYTFNSYTDYNYSSNPIKPNTTYNVRWALRENRSNTSYYYTTVTTKEGSLTVTKTLYLDELDFKVTLADLPENMPSSASYTLTYYVKEDGARSYRKGGTVTLSGKSSNNKYTDTGTVESLKAGTEYTVSFRDSDGTEFDSFTFTAPKDDRTVTVDSVTQYTNKFKIRASFGGSAQAYRTYVHLYYREKGTSAWSHSSEDDYFTEELAEGMTLSSPNSLKEGTAYEYVIGISDSDDTSVDNLPISQKGEVTTLKNTRTLNVTESHGYSYAQLQFNIDGGNTTDSGYYYIYYKLKDSNEWTLFGYKYYAGSSLKNNCTLSGLSAGKEYEYAVVLSDLGYVYDEDSNPTPDGNYTKVIGSFTTKSAEFELTLTPTESTYNQETFTVEATSLPEGETGNLSLTIKVSDGQGNDVYKAITLREARGYKSEVTFEGLTAAAEYTVTATGASIKEKYLYCRIYSDYSYTSTTSVDAAVTLKGTTTFKTPETQKPTALTLSETELKLNLDNNTELGNGVRLYVMVEPATAAADVTWSSADTSIATVDSDGVVKPVDIGETTVTATSKYDSSVTTTCTVKVKDYKLGVPKADGSIELYTSNSVDLYKNSTFALRYYEFGKTEDGKTTSKELESYNVSSSKPLVATWSKDTKEIQALQVGSNVVLTFEADGYTNYYEVEVKPNARGFGITGLSASNDSYPAIDKGNDSNGNTTYEIAYSSGVTYTAEGEITPSESLSYNAEKYTWKSSDTSVATVSAYGVITPLKAGTAEITVTAPEGQFTDVSEVKFTVEVKALPTQSISRVNAVTNVKKTLQDVTLDAGWSWKYPSTPLYSLPVSSSSYSFETVYTGGDYYAKESTVSVYICTITGVRVSEQIQTGTVNYYHKGVLQAGGTDAITFNLYPTTTGGTTGSSDYYTTNVTCKKTDVAVTQNKDGSWSVTATKAGKYTLDTAIYVDGKEVAKESYTVTAVDVSPVSSIELSTDKTVTQNVAIQDGLISFDVSEKTEKGTISVVAVATDREGKVNETTKLEWKSTDKTVATVTADKTDSRKAVIQVKGEGHAVIQVTAKDAAGVYTQLDLEIQNHQPRVNTSKATVNMAFDYDSYYGWSCADSLYGGIEIVPVYGESISSYALYEKDSISGNFRIYDYTDYEDYTYLVVPKKDEIKNGTYTCTMQVTTDAGNTYSYPLKVTVINKKPKVTAKVTGSMNLFYVNEEGELTVTVDKSIYYIDSLTWDDGVNDVSNGFSFSANGSNGSTKRYYAISQENIKVKDGKLVNSNIASGTLKVKLLGVKDAYEIKNVKVKYNYKKPTLKTYDSKTGKNVSSIVPAAGGNDFYVYVVDTLQAKKVGTYNARLSYSTDYSGNKYYYEVSTDNQNVDLNVYSNLLSVIYNGSKAKDSIALTFYSDNWRDSLKVTHSVKAVQPKALLSNDKLTYNTAYMSEVNSYISLKDYGAIILTDVEIKGADSKSQALLDDDKLQIVHNADGYSNSYRITSQLNKVKLANQTISNGTYTYNLTPCYTNAEGNRTALNTVKLKITITDKPITVKVSGKGTIDKTKSSGYSNSVVITEKFSNLGTGYSYTENTPVLTGEYSDYFRVSRSYGKYYVSASYSAQLKSGQTYKLKLVYTVTTNSGETVEVTSNEFKVKVKQTAPKVTVTNNNQTLYAGASSLTRSYYITVPSVYMISSASGSIDVNKDGTADITVSESSSGNGYAYLTVKITDQDAVLATTKGKTYSIPVTVRMRGRDGIAKDSTVSIKVTVKR